MALLDINVQSTSRLQLEPIKKPDGGYLFNGCIPTRVIDVHIGEQEHTKGEFKDMKVPVLQAEFENLKLNPSDPDKFYTHSFKVVGTKQLVTGTSDQYENRKEIDILNDTNDLWKTIKHFLENLYLSPNYRDITKIPKQDITAYFDLPGIDTPEKRIEGYNKFFNYIIKFVNGDGKDIKSQIVDTEGKALPMWIKMLPNYDRDPNRNKKYYTISRFIGQGVFEAMKTEKGLPVGSPKMIKVKPTESLELSIASASNAANAAQASMVTPGIDPAVAKLLGGQ